MGDFQAAGIHIRPWYSGDLKNLPRLSSVVQPNFFNPAAMLDYLLAALTAPNAPSVRIYINGNAFAIRPDGPERISPPAAFNDRDIAIAAIADNAPCLSAG